MERQREAIAKYAKAQRIEIVRTFSDEGVSGTTGLDERPAMLDLLEAIMSNGVKTILIERADRLGRDLIKSELILEKCREQGISVIGVDAGTDLTTDKSDATRTLIRQVAGAVAQFEKETIVQKLRAARAKKRITDGRCEGRKPFGFYDGEEVTLARIRELRRKRKGHRVMSYQRIADTLNAEGRSSRSGKPWRSASVRQIVNAQGLRSST